MIVRTQNMAKCISFAYFVVAWRLVGCCRTIVVQIMKILICPAMSLHGRANKVLMLRAINRMGHALWKCKSDCIAKIWRLPFRWPNDEKRTMTMLNTTGISLRNKQLWCTKMAEVMRQAFSILLLRSFCMNFRMFLLLLPLKGAHSS